VLFDKGTALSPTINVFGTVESMGTNSLYYSLWDLSNGTAVKTWSHFYNVPAMGDFYDRRDFYETLVLFHLSNLALLTTIDKFDIQ